MTQVYADEQVAIEAYLGLGRMGNNCYVIAPAEPGAGVVIVDAPEGIEAVTAALGDTPVERVVVTHSHRDHWNGFAPLRAWTKAPIYAGAEEANLDPAWGALPLADGETFEVGGAQVQVVHTPGHTPGSICLLVNRAVLTGDTLFPGGPGYSRSPELLAQEIESIKTRLLTLRPDTVVLPGHGAGTTIASAKAEYEVFASKPHAPGLHGDVLWLES